MLFKNNNFCSFNLKKAKLTLHEAAFCFEDSLFSLLPIQKNVYGASVIIFEGIMSFADKQLLQVRLFCFFFFLKNSQVKWSNHHQLLLFEQLLCWSEHYWTVQGCLLFLPAAPGYENLCGHRLRHTAGPPAPQGLHRAWTGHWRCHQAVQ